MWDQKLKQKGKKPGVSGSDAEGGQTLKAPDVDGTLADVDAALAMSGEAQAERQKAERLVRAHDTCSCCCFSRSENGAYKSARKLLGR
jgi:hypothetical protein